jgi:thiosulfate dehydrogenase
MSKARLWLFLPGLAVLALSAAAGFTGIIHAAPQSASHPASRAGIPPLPSSQQQLIRQGKLIFDDTPRYAAEWTGNVLSCTDCHRLSGTVPYATPLTATAARYPRFSKRAGHIVTLQQRIQECFVRSENGKPLPVNSPQMNALVAYLHSISASPDSTSPGKSKPAKYLPLVALPALTGNPARGKVLYMAQCAACHQANGEGRPEAFPPVWGPDSYNDGAGMSHNAKFAAWIQYNMPIQSPGTLTAQQAWDIAAYVNSQPRPRFNEAYKSY